jgi:hypothetical protein
MLGSESCCSHRGLTSRFERPRTYRKDHGSVGSTSVRDLPPIAGDCVPLRRAGRTAGAKAGRRPKRAAGRRKGGPLSGWGYVGSVSRKRAGSEAEPRSAERLGSPAREREESDLAPARQRRQGLALGRLRREPARASGLAASRMAGGRPPRGARGARTARRSENPHGGRRGEVTCQKQRWDAARQLPLRSTRS